MTATAIFIPAMRPNLITDLIDNIEDVTPEPHEVHVIGDARFWSEVHVVLIGSDLRLSEDTGGTWGSRLNFLFGQTTTPYVFLGADDVRFHEGWLSAALATMRQVDGVVAVNDLYNPHGTLALVSRRYVDEESGCVDTSSVVIFPGYWHNYSETELFETAQSRGRFAYCVESVVEHLHPAVGKGERDWVYDLGTSHLEEDSRLYLSRRHLWM